MVTTAEGKTFETIGHGDAVVSLPNSNESTHVTLQNALYSPETPFTIVSVAKLDQAGFSARFGESLCTIYAPNQAVIARIPTKQGLYHTLDTVMQGHSQHSRRGHQHMGIQAARDMTNQHVVLLEDGHPVSLATIQVLGMAIEGQITVVR